MASYVVLINWTDQGIRSAKDTLNRAQAFRELAQSMDAKVGSIQWTIGPYDIVSTVEAPDDETMTRLTLAVGIQGNARTQTLRAFGEADMKKILAGL